MLRFTRHLAHVDDECGQLECQLNDVRQVRGTRKRDVIRWDTVVVLRDILQACDFPLLRTAGRGVCHTHSEAFFSMPSTWFRSTVFVSRATMATYRNITEPELSQAPQHEADTRVLAA